ncbi:hypothetical protein SETIT_1G249900v2 [Setaria italica]|uniref:At1g61320/AtMIF1 LRR domain-containing protein n=2 Tax=Setaria italica TaxID=4555 RepID=A0A368PP01_SETIT|nr:uncharacterized protein LOC101783675 [Setaria italica]RCV07501.1 hypothetical protein SETIT_1G249900v2 [Setaria italica]
MAMLNLNQLVSLQRQRQRRRQRHRRIRQIQARDGPISSRAKRKGSPCQNDDNSLDGQIKGYSGPNLPEDIWCHIHSLMPMRDAAQAACVSRAFLGSWRCYPNLAFTVETLGLNENACGNDKKSRDFASTVHHILKKHSGIGVKTFKLNVYNKHEVFLKTNKQEICLVDLENWLQIAIKPGIEELDLSLSERSAMYNFPCSLLSDGIGDSLRYLHLSSCNFHPTVRLGCLRSLTRLALCSVRITGDELECLLSSSFALEWLELKLCSGIICLKIPCLQQLSHLEVITCSRLHVVESKAPNLSSFRFAGDLNIQLSLLGTSRIKKYERFCSGTVFYARTELPSSMANLETLSIYSEVETVNTPMVPSKFLHLKFLTITLGGQTYDVFSLVSFFYASPSLETFILNVRPEESMERISLLEDPSNLRKISEHRHNKLKRVWMINFSSIKTLVELTCHILDSTTSLECLTMDTTHGAPRCSCSVNKSGKCLPMRRNALMEAHRALLAIQTYIKPKVPSTVELNVLEPCSRCHLLEV